MNDRLEQQLRDAAGTVDAPAFDATAFAARAAKEGLADVAYTTFASPVGEPFLRRARGERGRVERRRADAAGRRAQLLFEPVVHVHSSLSFASPSWRLRRAAASEQSSTCAISL